MVAIIAITITSHLIMTSHVTSESSFLQRNPHPSNLRRCYFIVGHSRTPAPAGSLLGTVAGRKRAPFKKVSIGTAAGWCWSCCSLCKRNTWLRLHVLPSVPPPRPPPIEKGDGESRARGEMRRTGDDSSGGRRLRQAHQAVERTRALVCAGSTWARMKCVCECVRGHVYG